MDYGELEEKLRDSAIAQIDKRDCAGIMKYLEPLYAETELAQWAFDKFGVEIDPKEFLASEKGGRNTRKTADEISELIQERARQAYARREIEYPVDHILAYATGGGGADAAGGSIENPYAAEFVRNWALAKFGIEIEVPKIQQMSVRKLRDELIEEQQKWLTNGKIDALADELLKTNPSPEQLDKMLLQKFAFQSTSRKAFKSIEQEERQAYGTGVTTGTAIGAIEAVVLPPREKTVKAIRHFLRKELTDLEQFVLIQILDQSWKDHLYAMDLLRNSVGLMSFAEKDPRIVYKKEGFRFFEEMLMGVRDKTTDLIFRARIGQAQQARNAYNVTAATHEETSSYGVSENLQNMAPPEGEQQAQAGGEEGAVAVKTIVNEQAKVGRNDPCPCGSGKKYKKCHGVNAA
jgi:preprotein translocase subunit SecA